MKVLWVLFFYTLLSCFLGDKRTGMITREDVGIVVVACVEGKCSPNSTFEVINGPKEGGLDLDKLSNLIPD